MITSGKQPRLRCSVLAVRMRPFELRSVEDPMHGKILWDGVCRGICLPYRHTFSGGVQHHFCLSQFHKYKHAVLEM